MSTLRVGLAVFAVVVAVTAPYSSRTWLVQEPRADAERASYQRQIAKRVERRDAIRSQLAAMGEAEAARPPSVLVTTAHVSAAAERARATEARVVELETEIPRLREREASLMLERDGVARLAVEYAARRAELEPATRALRSELADVEKRVADLDARVARDVVETERLARERVQWTDRESLQGLPRVAAVALAGRSDDGGCAGAQLSLYTTQVLGQRLGLSAGMLIEDRFSRAERYFVGPLWQKLLTPRVHLDLWAGHSWYATNEVSGGELVAGGTLARTFTRWNLSLGLTGIGMSGSSMVGVAVGFSQIGGRW